ncbi:MAG: alkaline phosphatase D family protein [Acidobacteriota bacterium]
MRHRVLLTLTCGLLLAWTTGALARPPAPPDRVRERLNREIGDRQIREQFVPVVTGQAEVPGTALGTRFFPQSIASGDPRPDSVVLWTRVLDPDLADQDVPVRLIVTQDPFFNHVVYNQVVTAQAQYDHCVKVQVGGLAPRTSYLYFFVYVKDGVFYLSRLGTTKTAPDPADTRPVRFAFFSCQDWEGNYYNIYAKLLLDHRDDIDFVVFIGDYIYETAGQPGFQHPTPGRRLTFTDPGAIQLSTAGIAYYAAGSLDNYRYLYATYRSDPMLQQLHETFPMVATWDDHEYSNDCHGDVAAYFDKRKDEADPVRRRNAEQAFFEYMPITPGLGADGTLAIDDTMLYPNAHIYQELHFGANLDLMLTDYRSFRPDVVVPEDAFPGTILMDKTTLLGVLGEPTYDGISASLDPYVDVDLDPALQAVATAIVTQLVAAENSFLTPEQAAQRASALVAGNLSATYLNALFAGAEMTPPFDEAALATFDRGLSVLYLGKRDLYTSTGSRYVLVKDTFDLYSGFRYAVTGGASEDVYGAAQEAWIRQTLSASTATWKVYASSVSMTPMILDFTSPLIAPLLPPGFPDQLRTRLLIDADQWDGFPHKRAEIVGLLKTIPGAVLISGDIHSSFVSDHGDGLFEFTGTAVTSQTLADEVRDMVAADPLLSRVPGINDLLDNLGTLLLASSLDPAVSAARIVDDALEVHGGVVIEASADQLRATYYHIPSSEVTNNYYDDPASLARLFTLTSYTVENGTISFGTP